MKRFGTFDGVFTPTTLTILGVIMYLRLGWVVGNAGLLGAIVIILLAKSVTLSTGLSMSSMASNIKIGAGGAYTFISRSLGLEAGGSIGIPLYIALTLSAALYIVGFTEGWLWIFPGHNPLVIGLIAWVILTIVSVTSTELAIKIQYLIMGVILISLLSFYLGPDSLDVNRAPLIGNFEDAGFWQIFAVFFPAVTGIMAGISLSGELKNPRRSIVLGTMSSIFVTMVIYVSLAVLLSRVASPEELRGSELIMADKSFFAPLVVAGVMGATLSSALATMVGAPRVLHALAQEETIPLAGLLSKTTEKHEPRVAILVTGLIIGVSIAIGDLNSLATLITMFFMITYGMINLVVFTEQSMQFIGFRPSFRVPRAISLFGAVACFVIMLLIDMLFTVVAAVFVVLIYVLLTKKKLGRSSRDIRAGLFQFLAERALRLAARLPSHQVSWKPDILVPVEHPDQWQHRFDFIRDIVSPSGSVYAFSVQSFPTDKRRQALKDILSPLDKRGILVSSASVEEEDFFTGCKIVLQTLINSPFRPNSLFLNMGGDEEKDELIRKLVKYAYDNGLGVMILREPAGHKFDAGKDINLWLRDRSTNWHLAVLVALQLQMNWDGKINLITVSTGSEERYYLEAFLERLCDLARIPASSELHILSGPFSMALESAPKADINIFGVGTGELPLDFMRSSVKTIDSACVFIKDSGFENALV